jgi:hypothetical protein
MLKRYLISIVLPQTIKINRLKTINNKEGSIKLMMSYIVLRFDTNDHTRHLLLVAQTTFIY